ncbi:hypothetical protein AB1N83_013382 [Pleurotus pulmonarius]
MYECSTQPALPPPISPSYRMSPPRNFVLGSWRVGFTVVDPEHTTRSYIARYASSRSSRSWRRHPPWLKKGHGSHVACRMIVTERMPLISASSCNMDNHNPI